MATRRARPKNDHRGRRGQPGSRPPDNRITMALEEALVMRSRVLESMVEGVSISDEQGVILYTNPAEDAMFGYGPGELLGRHVSVQNTYPPEENARIVQEVIAQLKARGSWQGEFHNRKKDGTPFTTFARITALEVSGRHYWVCVQEDVTLRRATEEALRSSQERLALAHQAARLGTFDWNIQTDQVVWSREEEALYGLPPGGFGGQYASWRQAVHPEDRGRAEQAVRDAARTGADLDTEFRVVWPDGSVRWMVARARVLRDSAGRPLRMIGVNEDITERKLAEAERARLYEAEQQARARAELVQRRLAFLADLTIHLTASLEYATRLQQLARLSVPTLADYCVVYVQQADGWITRVAIAHVDPEQEQQIAALQTQDRIDPEGPTPIALLFRCGEAEIVRQTQPEKLVPLAQGSAQLLAWQHLRPHAYMLFPLRVHDRVLGAMSFVLTDPERTYTDEDVTLAAEVARRAALALDNARLYRDAQDAIQLRDQFLSVAAHELKTPLTSLLGNAQLLQRRDQRDQLLGPRERRNVEVIVDQATRLNRMVSTLLDISRLEAGQLTIERRPLDLGALVRRIVEEAAPGLEERPLDLRCPEEPLLVEGDELRLEQVFQNLLQNAVKYSPPDAPVAVEVARQAGEVAVAVRDRGIGIPSEALPRLFQRFFRASNVSGGSVVGLGIGLYVVREIVALHGGAVEVASAEGQGSTFTVRLPLAEPSEPPTARA